MAPRIQYDAFDIGSRSHYKSMGVTCRLEVLAGVWSISIIKKKKKKFSEKQKKNYSEKQEKKILKKINQTINYSEMIAICFRTPEIREGFAIDHF